MNPACRLFPVCNNFANNIAGVNFIYNDIGLMCSRSERIANRLETYMYDYSDVTNVGAANVSRQQKVHYLDKK